MVFVVILSPRRRRSARRICFSQKRPERSGIIATSAMMSGRLYGSFQQRQRPFSRSFDLARVPRTFQAGWIPRGGPRVRNTSRHIFARAAHGLTTASANLYNSAAIGSLRQWGYVSVEWGKHRSDGRSFSNRIGADKRRFRVVQCPRYRRIGHTTGLFR
jgi:hypothetical protein